MAAHACYSTSGALIAAIKRWTAKRGKIFSIHAAEHMEEMEFLHSGSGYCRELLDALGKWEPGWAPPRTTPVQYLDRLGVLDRRTLLVHAVYLTNEDWETVAARECSICFCPRSNRSIGAGRADIGKALSSGILPALGTDSLASNTDLSLFAEAAHALDAYPEVSPEAALAMATLGGARALGRDGQYGSIEPGKRAALLAAPIHPSTAPRKGAVEEAIIHRGAEGECQWVSRP
jgi:cytosine/adenosine deaminase-related metal-dependent hydrolase